MPIRMQCGCSEFDCMQAWNDNHHIMSQLFIPSIYS